jgi:uncharacterized delta-60 repeat protein
MSAGDIDTKYGIVALDNVGKVLATKATSDDKILVASQQDKEGSISRYKLDGTVDNSFGDKGILKVATGRLPIELDVQPDGKVLAVLGAIPEPDKPFFYRDLEVVRFNSDGSIDNTFQKISGSNSFGYSPNYTRNLFVKPNGKIVFISGGDILNYSANGALESTTKDVIKDDRHDFTADGKIVTAGLTGNKRFNSDGTLDTSFKAALNTDNVIAGNDGSCFVYSPTSNSGIPGSIYKLNADGSLDKNFATSIYPQDNGYITFTDSIPFLLPNGKLLVKYAYTGEDSRKPYTLITSYNSDGSSDSSFGGDGGGKLFDKYIGFPQAIFVQKDGDFGIISTKTSTSPARLIRYQTQGGVAAPINITGTSGDDVISGGSGNDVLLGGDGNDVMNGEKGNDKINGENGNDEISGGTGDDTIYGANGDDYLNGSEGNDYLNGGDGNDNVNGGNGDDYIEGGRGIDRLLGDDGNDTIKGGDDNDELIGNNGNDSLEGGDGVDNLTGGKGNDYLNGGSGSDDQSGGDGNDTLVGGDGADILNGDYNPQVPSENKNSGNDFLYGGNGNDQLYGNASNDYLNGGYDNDVLVGGDGVDTLIGDLGDDSLYGGNDNDVLSAGDGKDILNGGYGNDVMNGENGDDSLFGDLGNDSIDGANGNDTLYGGEGADVLNGGNGNDLLVGGAGNDTLTGGANQDFFGGFSTSSLDTITDFQAGTDKISLNKGTFSVLQSLAGSGFSVANEFAIVSSASAVATSKALIVYNSQDGTLSYNVNREVADLGVGGGAFAKLEGLPINLTANDFQLAQ